MLVVGMPVVKTFLSNTSLIIYVFLIKKITMKIIT